MIYVVKNAQKHAVPMGKAHKKARVYRSTEPRTKMKKNLEIPGPKVPKTLHTSTSASSATSASVPRRSSTPSSPTNGNEPQILDTTTRHDTTLALYDTTRDTQGTGCIRLLGMPQGMDRMKISEAWDPLNPLQSYQILLQSHCSVFYGFGVPMPMPNAF